MARLILSLTAVYLLLCAATCERDLDLDVERSPKLVVNSNFGAGQLMRVSVSQSQNILDTGNEASIANAKIDLFEGTTHLETLARFIPASDTTAFYYGTLNTRPRAGQCYTISVVVPGFEDALATSCIPQPVPIQSLARSGLMIRENAEGREFSYDIKLTFQDPPEERNYYHLNLFQQVGRYIHDGSDNQLIVQQLFRAIAFSPATSTNDLQAYPGGGILIQDDPLLGSYTFRVNTKIDPDFEILGKLYAELRSVSEEYYLFHKSLARQSASAGQGTLSNPVMVYNNIQNGFGVFSGYISTYDSLSIIQ